MKLPRLYNRGRSAVYKPKAYNAPQWIKPPVQSPGSGRHTQLTPLETSRDQGIARARRRSGLFSPPLREGRASRPSKPPTCCPGTVDMPGGSGGRRGGAEREKRHPLYPTRDGAGNVVATRHAIIARTLPRNLPRTINKSCFPEPDDKTRSLSFMRVYPANTTVQQPAY